MDQDKMFYNLRNVKGRNAKKLRREGEPNSECTFNVAVKENVKDSEQPEHEVDKSEKNKQVLESVPSNIISAKNNTNCLSNTDLSIERNNMAINECEIESNRLSGNFDQGDNEMNESNLKEQQNTEINTGELSELQKTVNTCRKEIETSIEDNLKTADENPETDGIQNKNISLSNIKDFNGASQGTAILEMENNPSSQPNLKRKSDNPTSACLIKKKNIDGDRSTTFVGIKDERNIKTYDEPEQTFPESENNDEENNNSCKLEKSDQQNAIKAENNNNSVNYSRVGKVDPFSNIFGITVQLIGTKVIKTDAKPLNALYHLAIERNRRRTLFDNKTNLYDDPKYLKWLEIEVNKLEKEKRRDARQKEIMNLQIAKNITKNSLEMLNLLNSDTVDEQKIVKYLLQFLYATITPTSLLYVPQVVHIILFCRGYKNFSKQLRMLADNCYQKCHAMFPIPEGYNFETVYTSEVKKFLPESCIDSALLDYDDVSGIIDIDDMD